MIITIMIILLIIIITIIRTKQTSQLPIAVVQLGSPVMLSVNRTSVIVSDKLGLFFLSESTLSLTLFKKES